jgi:FKBP-type peptidyl-prolyl cis-trans isomerase SlyD
MDETVEKNDFVLIDFVGTTTVDGQVFEKTSPNSPVLVVAGAKQVLAALDSHIIGSKLREPRTVLLPFMQAFGPRREELVRLIPLSQFTSAGVDPKPGQVVELDGMPAKVKSVSAGRVRVDFNHELAGKDVQYVFTVKKKFSDALGKATAAAENMMHLKPQDVTLLGETLKLEVGVGVTKDANYFVSKAKLVSLVLENISQISKVDVLEHYAKPTKTP